MNSSVNGLLVDKRSWPEKYKDSNVEIKNQGLMNQRITTIKINLTTIKMNMTTIKIT